jgi:peptidoglycan/xylan/chitin deacetylase (PgdA/CDA1 family)
MRRSSALSPDRLPPLALAYHGVAEVPLRRDPEHLFVRPQDLRTHLRRLRVWGYRLVSFSELASRVADGEAAGFAALTFDDGLADNLLTLAPLLRHEGATATVFVTSCWLGLSYPAAPWARLLTRDELRELARLGLEIGGHTRTHPDLSRLSYAEAREELEGGKAELEEIVETAVEVAAYPFGQATVETMRACRDAGFRAACRTSGQGTWSDPYNLPRQAMENRCSDVGLWLKRHDRYEPLMRLQPARAARKAGRRLRELTGR